MCSNHIGASTIVVTKDSRIPIGKQTKDSIGSPGRWAPTGSGSVDYDDLDKIGYFRPESRCTAGELIVKAMEREVEEESNILSNMMNTFIIGYCNLLHRGAKPEFFGISFTEMRSSDVKILGSEPLYMEDYVSEKVRITDERKLGEH